MLNLEVLQAGDSVILPAFDDEYVTGSVNLVERDSAGWIRTGGSLTGSRSGSFAISSSGKAMQGVILFPGEGIAYEIATQRDGQVLLQEKLLSDVICFPLPLVDPWPAAASASLPNLQKAPPLLSSRPQATAVVYLDFDGETVTDTHWNGGSTIVARAPDFSGEQIIEIWKRVWEDFRPFNLDITTDLSRYINAPVGRRMRVIITPDSDARPGSGGVALMNSFRSAGQEFSATIPCWVFNLGTVSCAETISHEVGHTLGLWHDGRYSPFEEYYYGHGTGALGWAPIMGASFYQSVTQWSKGEYAHANNAEDDIAIITDGANGFGFIPDEAGDSIQSAASLRAAGSVVNREALVSHAADVDFFAFNCVAGPVNVQASPTVVGPNLDIRLELQDQLGSVIASSSPDTSLNAAISAEVTEGTHYLRIQGTGHGDVQWTGYSNYGSLGAYTLTGTVPRTAHAPVISSAGTASGMEGTMFRYEIVAANAPVDFAVSGVLPVGLALDPATGLIAGVPAGGTAGSYTVTIRATNEVGTGQKSLVISILPPLTLAQALEAPGLSWTTLGDGNWLPQSSTSHDGLDAARSGAIGDSQTTRLRTDVAGPATLSFWWRVDSEANYDFLSFHLDGVMQTSISGNTTWSQAGFFIPAGEHAVEWRYTKDIVVSVGQDAGWVDEVTVTDPQPPQITSPGAAAGTIGESFSYQITGTNSPTGFGVTGSLPAGVFLNAGSGLISGVPSSTGAFVVTVAATNPAGTGTRPVTLSISNAFIPIGDAVDAPDLSWTTGGASNWRGQTAITSDYVDAARSGTVDHNQQSWVRTSVSGPAVVVFRWKVDSEGGWDYLRLKLDGEIKAAISGSIDWNEGSVEIPAGPHTLEWAYEKDVTISIGADAGWLDAVVVSSLPTRVIELSGDLAFSSVTVGSSAMRTMTIRNNGNAPLTVFGISYPDGFSGPWAGTIPPGVSQNVTVSFAPASAGVYGGNVTVNSDKTAGNAVLPVSGTGIAAPVNTRIIELEGDLDFGDVAVGSSAQRALTMRNLGNSTLGVSGISFPSGFSGNWSGAILPGQSAIVAVTFAPATVTGYTGSINVASDKTGGAETIAAAGNGVAEADPLVWDDIGGPARAGSQKRNAAARGYQILAGGVDMWGASDQFRFGHRLSSGNGELVMRVGAISGPHPWARAGLTFRQSMAADAAHVTLIATAGNGVDLQWRSANGGATEHLTSQFGVNPTPVYLKLARSDSTFTGYRSENGSAWTEVGSIQVLLPANVDAGIAVCAISTTGLVSTQVSGFQSTLGEPVPETRVIALYGDMEFGDTTVGTIARQTLTVRNHGNAALDVFSISLPAGFSSSLSGVVAPGGSISALVMFSPAGVAEYGGTITVQSNKTGGADTIGISGTGTAVPDPLVWEDIGAPAVAGHQTRRVNRQSYAIAAGGLAMWGNADQFRFGHKSVTGDGEQVVFVEEIAGPGAWSRVGLSVRESLDPGSAHVTIIATTGNGLDVQWRSTNGADTVNIGGEQGASLTSIYLKLVRTGNLLTGYRSNNGTNWTEVGSATANMPAVVHVGIVACAVSPTETMTARVSAYTSSFVEPKLPATVTLEGLSHVFDGSPKSVTVATVPAGLSVGVTYNGGPNPPASAGSYSVVATVLDANYAGSATGTLTIARAPQSVSFAPLADHVFGDPPFALSGSASSGLPVSFAVIAGPATINGNTLTITGGGIVSVRASQAGNTNFLAAVPVVRSFNVATAAATITFSGLTQTYDGSPKAVTATTNPPGLTVEITYDGSATPPSLIGNYTVVATIVDANFSGTTTATLTIEPADHSGIYFGEMASSAAGETSPQALSGPSVWGLMVAPDGRGIFLCFLSGTPAAIIADVLVQPDGTFSGTTSPIMDSSALAPSSRADAAFAADVTVSGRITARVVSGEIAGLGVSLTGAKDVPVGGGTIASGLYTASVLGAFPGGIHLLVGPGGQVVIVISATFGIDGGPGTMDGAGQIAASLSNGTTVVAIVDATSGRVTGTIALASSPTPLSIAGLSSAVAPLNRVVNLSTRGFVGAGDDVMIAGFVIGGTGSRTVLVRAIGPTLGTPDFGVGGALGDARLVLRRESDVVAVNDDWGTNDNLPAIFAAMEQTGAFLVSPTSQDAMLLLDLPAGPYTATIEGEGGTGVAIAEVYSVGEAAGSDARLVNVSTRGFVGTGAGIMIPGFVTSGNTPRHLLIRAVGPTLVGLVGGAMEDPVLSIYTADGFEVAGNDDWDAPGLGDIVASITEKVGAFELPRGSRDAALLFVVPPDTPYTIQVSGKDGATGVVIAEVYEVP